MRQISELRALFSFRLKAPMTDALKDIKRFLYRTESGTIASQLRRIKSRKSSAKNYLDGNDTSEPQHIIFAPIFSFSDKVIATEAILASALRIRGHEVSTLICDQTLPACLYNVYGNHSLDTQGFVKRVTAIGKTAECHRCGKLHRHSQYKSGAKKLSLRQFSGPNTLKSATEYVDANLEGFYKVVNYKGVNITEHAYASTLRKLTRGTLKDDDWSRFLFRRFMIAAVVYIDALEKLIDEEAPDVFVCVHGIYLEHGVLADYAKTREVRVVIHGTPYRKHTIWLSHDDTYHRTLVSEPNSRWENKKLTPAMSELIDEYLSSKISGGRENVNYNPNPILERQAMREVIGLRPDRPIVALFTNTLWDAQVVYRSNAFANMLDWLFASIDFFIQKPEIQFVVRIHPAESKGGFSTDQPIAEEIAARYADLPDHISIIKPESNVSSVLLADESIASIIYGTKLGIELAYRGRLVICAGESLCRGKGFTLDVNSAEEYFRVLESVRNLTFDTQAAAKRAEKYAYHLFYEVMMDFKQIDTDMMTNQKILVRVHDEEELAAGENEVLDIICSGILEGTPFESTKGIANSINL